LIRLYVGNRDARNPLLSPLFGDLHGLPPLLIQVGGGEILLSDSVRFAERARLADIAVALEISEGMGHVWHVFAPFVLEAKQAIRSIGDFVQKHVETHKEHDTPP
jgi:acetyl esterase/lipase